MARKINIDIARFVVALFIVAIHVYPFVSFSETFDYMITRVVFRIGVPFFLMLTGYYILPKALKNVEILKEYTIKILKLYGICILIYLPVNIYNGYFSDSNLWKIIKDVFINGTFYHLWYFPALILGIWIIYFLIKKLDFKKIVFVVVLLFIIGLFGDSYYGFIKNINLLKMFYDGIFEVFDYTRNGLFYVPVFVYIGYYISKKESNKSVIFLILFLILMIIEGFLLYHFKIPKHNSMYLFLLPLSYFLFLFLIANNHSSNKKVRDMATWIYILHPLFIVVVRLISKISHISILIENSFINYILVVVLTIVIVLIFEKTREVIKHGK